MKTSREIGSGLTFLVRELAAELLEIIEVIEGDV